MLAHVRQCEATGIYDARFDEIDEIYAQNFNNRHKGCNFDRPYMQNGTDPNIDIAGVDVYEYM